MDDEKYGEHNKKFQEWLPQKFREWVPGKKSPVNILILCKHDICYAIATEYDLVTTGRTALEAHNDLEKLLSHYLNAFFECGQPYEKSLRPSPWTIRMSFKAHLYLTILKKRLLRQNN